MEKLQVVEPLAVCIETPVLTSTNVTNYRKQASTIAIMEFMLMTHIGQVLIEVNPTEVKAVAAGKGNATKKDIIAASPFTGSGPSVEAIADAWAICVAGMRFQGRAERPRLDGKYDTHHEEIL